MVEELKKEEKARTKLSPKEIESKKNSLAEQETNKRNYEQQLINVEVNLDFDLPTKQLESQIAQIEAQIEVNKKLLPILKEQLENGQPRKDALTKKRQLKEFMKINESNISFLRRQINTGYA